MSLSPPLPLSPSQKESICPVCPPSPRIALEFCPPSFFARLMPCSCSPILAEYHCICHQHHPKFEYRYIHHKHHHLLRLPPSTPSFGFLKQVIFSLRFLDFLCLFCRALHTLTESLQPELQLDRFGAGLCSQSHACAIVTCRQRLFRS